MRFKFLLIYFLFLHVVAVAQDRTNDERIATIDTKCGQLKFVQSCKRKSLKFYQGNQTIIDKSVEKEAFERNIDKDKMKLRLKINEKGKIISCSIVRKAKIDHLNIFITELFNEVISEMSTSESVLDCKGQATLYKIKLKYVRQKDFAQHAVCCQAGRTLKQSAVNL